MKVFDIDLYAYFGLDKPEAGRGLLTCYELAVTPEISLERKSPAILIMPGGGYQGVSDREAEPVALTYTAAGYHAFVLRYSTAPAGFPTQLREAAMAMIYIRENADALHVRSDRVAALGFSAGGHLCSTTLHWISSVKKRNRCDRMQPCMSIPSLPRENMPIGAVSETSVAKTPRSWQRCRLKPVSRRGVPRRSFLPPARITACR